MVPRAAPPRRFGTRRRAACALALLALLGLPSGVRAAHAGDPPPPPPAPPTSSTARPAAPEGSAFLAPEPARGALGRPEDVAELAVAGDRVAAVLTDGGLRIGTPDALVAVAAPSAGDGWLHAAMPGRGPAIATTRRGFVHRVAQDGTTTAVGRIQRGALPAAWAAGEDVALATEGGAVYRVVVDGDGPRLVEAWPSGAEPANAVGCADGRVVVARTTGVVEVGPLAGPGTRWLALASPVTALAIGDGWSALGDARGRLTIASEAGIVGDPGAATDAEVVAIALLDATPVGEIAPQRIVVLEGGRRLRMHHATRVDAPRDGGAPLTLEPGARGLVPAGGDAVWLVGTDGRVRRVAAAPRSAPAASAPAGGLPAR